MGHVPAQSGQLLLPVDGTEFLQGLIPTADGLGCGRVDEGKRLDLTERKIQHAQDDLSQIGSLDLRLRVFVARGVILLGVQPYADAVLNTSATAPALFG